MVKKFPNPASKGSYPVYDSRWFMEKIGLPLEKCFMRWLGCKENTIALIDTPVAFYHPNLVGQIDMRKSIDLAVEYPVYPQEGYQVEEADKENFAKWSEMFGEDAAKKVCEIDAGMRRLINARLEKFGPTGREYSEAFAEYLSKSKEAVQAVGSHGTAMAGLMVGKPEVEALFRPDPTIDPDPNDPEVAFGYAHRLPFPFAGINPKARLYYVSISAEPTARHFCEAISYVKAMGANLIVISADIPRVGDPGFSKGSMKTPEYEDELWKLIDWRLEELSKDVPIICAAGNDPLRTEPADNDDFDIAYPARLSTNKNGIFAVTATNARDELASYAPNTSKIDLSAPSTDAERRDRDLTRLDVDRQEFGENSESVYLAGAKFDRVPPEAIISTDVPGRFGHNGSLFEDATLGAKASPDELLPRDPKTVPEAVLKCFIAENGGADVYFAFSPQYSIFGGTSAATAIVAGLFSLWMSQEGNEVAPVALKEKIRKKKHTTGEIVASIFPTMFE